jgi:hypothetical protein
MSTVPAPQPRSRPPTTTREQLDELDALLQRMLELPVDPSGDEAARPEETSDAPVAVAEAPAPVEPPLPPAAVETEPAPPAEGLANLSGPAVGVPALAGLRTPQPAKAGTPTPEGPPPGSLARPPLHGLWPAAAPWLRPLIAVNRLFDREVGRLGAPGRWLRRPRGRAVLGWAGLLLLAGALGLLLLGWIGWF